MKCVCQETFCWQKCNDSCLILQSASIKSCTLWKIVKWCQYYNLWVLDFLYSGQEEARFLQIHCLVAQHATHGHLGLVGSCQRLHYGEYWESLWRLVSRVSCIWGLHITKLCIYCYTLVCHLKSMWPVNMHKLFTVLLIGKTNACACVWNQYIFHSKNYVLHDTSGEIGWWLFQKCFRICIRWYELLVLEKELVPFSFNMLICML